MIPYFFDGYANTTPGNQQYAIFDPVYNRFIMVSDNSDLLMRTIMNLSGKTQLYLVPIQQAQNWNPNIIDNHCCENWGLSQINSYNLFSFPTSQDALIVDPVPDLTPNTVPTLDHEKELKKFAFLSYSIIKHWIDSQDWYLVDFYDFIEFPVTVQQQKALERQVYHTIYSAADYEPTHSKVKQLMALAPRSFVTKKLWNQQ